jgi:hypothetical protein
LGDALLSRPRRDDTLFVHFEGSDIVSIACPLRDLSDVGPAQPRADPLEVVPGVPRSRVLRMLGTPQPIGAIAAELAVRPAAASRHCNLQVRAALITRERHGRQVLASRTTRGTNLLDVL